MSHVTATAIKFDTTERLAGGLEGANQNNNRYIYLNIFNVSYMAREMRECCEGAG